MPPNSVKRRGAAESRLKLRGLVASARLSVSFKCLCLTLVLFTQVPKVLLRQGKAPTVAISLPLFAARKKL